MFVRDEGDRSEWLWGGRRLPSSGGGIGGGGGWRDVVRLGESSARQGGQGGRFNVSLGMGVGGRIG